jgi:hypothetical protein
MPIIDPLTYLKSVLAKDFDAKTHVHRRDNEEHHSLVITISRDYGALGEVIAKRIGRSLGIPVYDQEILDQVAKSAKTDKFHFEAHDEQSSAGLSAFLYSLISGNPANLYDYRRHLCAVVTELSRKDCIIIGRGAHLILAGRPIFRVRIVGSKVVCAHRIAEEFDIPLMQAEHKVFEINNKRHKAVIDLYSDRIEHCSLELAKNFDLVINTDHISIEGATGVVLLAMREAGLFKEINLCKP